MKVIKYYMHNFSRPIVKYGIKLVKGDIIRIYDNGTIELNGKMVELVKEKIEEVDKTETINETDDDEEQETDEVSEEDQEEISTQDMIGD